MTICPLSILSKPYMKLENKPHNRSFTMPVKLHIRVIFWRWDYSGWGDVRISRRKNIVQFGYRCYETDYSRYTVPWNTGGFGRECQWIFTQISHYDRPSHNKIRYPNIFLYQLAPRTTSLCRVHFTLIFQIPCVKFSHIHIFPSPLDCTNCYSRHLEHKELKNNIVI